MRFRANQHNSKSKFSDADAGLQVEICFNRTLSVSNAASSKLLMFSKSAAAVLASIELRSAFPEVANSTAIYPQKFGNSRGKYLAAKSSLVSAPDPFRACARI